MNTSEKIQKFSRRLIDAQAPIRILESVRWTDDVRDDFLARGGKQMPKVNRDWYRSRPLGFEPKSLTDEFEKLERDIRRSLGEAHPASAVLLRMCREYGIVVRMLMHRGDPGFGEHSRTLFGSSADELYPGEPSLAEFGQQIRQALVRIEPCLRIDDPDDIDNIPGTEAAVILQQRLAASMGPHGAHLAVCADDGIASDASAGADKIKLREDAMFSRRELRLLEVHEGWVHVGTTLNGRAQRVCQFLGKGTPSATITQEGLAVLVEILTLSSSPARQQRINNRIIAVEMAENGADFMEIYRFFIDQGISAEDSYQFTLRVFRGSTPAGPPFTKDLAYTRGFVLLYNFLRAAINAGDLDLIPLVFCGKTVLEDIVYLRRLYQEGLLQPPAYVPPQFTDLHGLAAWMCYDTVLAGFNIEALQQNYARLFR